MPSESPRSQIIRTERLILRRFAADDADLLVELDSDPEVMRYINGGVPVPRDEVLRSSLPRVLAAADPSRGTGFWTVFTASDRRPIGWIHLRIGHYWPDDLELGYRFFRRLWGQGYATEASAAVRDFAFEVLGAPRLIATTMRENIASARVMIKLGMGFEADFTELRWPGPDKRAVRYGMANPRVVGPIAPPRQ